MPDANVFAAAAAAPPGIPHTLVRVPGLALKALRVTGGGEPRRLAPPGQGFLLLVLVGALDLVEDGRSAEDLAPGDGWFQPGDRGASLRGGAPDGAVCLLVSTPTPAREPRRIHLLRDLMARRLPLPLLVHRNESVVVEARRLGGRLPLPGRQVNLASPAPGWHVVLGGGVRATRSAEGTRDLAPGDVLEVPAGATARLSAARGAPAFVLSLEALKAHGAPGSPRRTPPGGFDPWSVS
ncbi:hypothetical protein L6R50_18565 [Myxococcota bacterium]|nr:hypothetical protein [Myxococcota bacterium]